MQALVLTLISLLLLSSCSTGDKTNANIQVALGAQLDMNRFAGGVVLWGKQVGGSAEFGEVLAPDSDGKLDIELPNGSWSFYVVGWESLNFKDTPFCAIAKDIRLSGGERDLLLKLDNATCADYAFSPYSRNINGTIKFPAFNGIAACRTINGLTASSDMSRCELTGSTGRGFAQYFKVIIPSFRRDEAGIDFPSMNNELESECLPVNNVLTGGSWEFNIPLGNMDLGGPFQVDIQLFYDPTDSSCTKVDRSFTYHLEKGPYVATSDYLPPIYPGITSFSVSTDELNSTTTLFVSTPEDILCRIPSDTIGLHIGNGSAEAPYGICNPAELNIASSLIQNNSSANFVLLNDLDMNKLTKVINPDPSTLPGDFDCYSPGDNFLPFGATLTNNGSSCDYDGETTTFSGSFDGRGHRISNLRFGHEYSVNIGLFAKVSGATIENLTIEHGELRAAQYVGALIGLGSATIKNITVLNSRISADGAAGAQEVYAGGVAGSLEANSSLEDIRVFRTHISGAGGALGGAVGSFDSTSVISRIGVQAVLDAYLYNSDLNTSLMNIGGILGEIKQTNTISEVYFDGAIFAYNGVNIGGLIGEAGEITVNNSYAKGYILSGVSSTDGTSPTSVNIGGIIGYGSTIDVSNAYFAGSLHLGSNVSEFGAIFGGGSSGTITNAYYLNDYISDTTNENQIGTAKSDSELPLAITGFLTSSSLADPDNTPWYQNGDLPALMWEKVLVVNHPLSRPCLVVDSAGTRSMSIKDQITRGRGALTNPVWICNRSQMQELASDPQLLSAPIYYMLGANIFLGDWSNIYPTAQSTNFAGNLDGMGHMLYGATIYPLDSGYSANIALFGTTEGTNKNIILTGFNIHNNGLLLDNLAMAPWAINNKGILENIKVIALNNYSTYSSVADNNESLAGLVVNNSSTGSIIMSKVQGSINGNSNQSTVGGIVSYNNGKLFRIVSEAYFYNGNDSSNVAIGGIAGKNYNSITQAVFGGSAHLGSYEDSTNNYPFGGSFGGITALNSAPGELRDVMISEDSEIDIVATKDTTVASIAADNNSRIDRAIVAKDLTFINTSADPAFIYPVANNLDTNDQTTIFFTAPAKRDLLTTEAIETSNTSETPATFTTSNSNTLSFANGVEIYATDNSLLLELTPVTYNSTNNNFEIAVTDTSIINTDNFIKYFFILPTTGQGITGALDQLVTLTNFQTAGFDIELESDDKIDERIIAAYLSNDPDQGPVWKLEQHGTTLKMPTLMFDEFIDN